MKNVCEMAGRGGWPLISTWTIRTTIEGEMPLDLVVGGFGLRDFEGVIHGLYGHNFIGEILANELISDLSHINSRTSTI
jgi:hypothetical protein